MASGQMVRRARPIARSATAVCPDGPSGRDSSGAGEGWKVVALSSRGVPSSPSGVRVTVGAYK
eukprot:14072730-Alexandrium_andersonii.AAC.1